jgi:hypothetical protein
MTAGNTINELERLGTVQDALMKRLEDELREMRAANAEIGLSARRDRRPRCTHHHAGGGAPRSGGR